MSWFSRNKPMFYALAALFAAGWLWWIFPPTQYVYGQKEISFNRDVRPILNDNCLLCHGGVRQSGGFSLLFVEEAARPNESGKPAYIPGDPALSELMLRVRNNDPEERMPLDHPALMQEEINILEQWIEEGAEWETHWAYEKPKLIEEPQLRNASWAKNGIDRFILKRLEKEGLKPAPEATCSTLMRRVSLDLIGLPPTSEDVDVFCADLSPDVYEKVVDQLLASPHFGERWAAMWLDLARYADTKGYEKDGPRSIWKYRDWVISAFNRDLPFDAFTIEQLAGDLLPNPTEDQLIATAFHRNTMNNDEGGTDDEEFRMAAVIDRTNTTWEVWMGTTMACVQCHSHPYDPFTHKEYYEFLAFFNNTEDHDTPDEYPTLKTLSDSQRVEVDSFLPRSFIPEAKTPILRELEGEERRETHVLNRGNFLDPMEEVFAGVPQVMPAIPDDEPNDRLMLSKWIVSEDNPLTSRVIVNRFWEQIFGIGIIETTEDFGTRGMEASHPQLLDWLAHQFVHKHQWSVKSLLKQMVTSAAYRQQFDGTQQKLELDPNNRLLSRGSRVRLSAEQIRDQALAVSGLLSTKMFGPSVYPYQPEGIWNAPYSSMKWEVSEAEDRHRRGLYTYWRRSAPYPSMVAFDSPSREVCVSRRISTNTPLQALVTLNDPVFVEAAEALAIRVLEEDLMDLDSKLVRVFKLALMRDPAPVELTVLRDLYKKAYFDFEDQIQSNKMPLDNEGADPETASLTVVSNAILNLDEFMMKG